MKSKTKPTVKNLISITIEENPLVIIRFSGEGFLHNMVRILTGTLVEAGFGTRTPETVREILKDGKRDKAGARAPAKGLFLESVKYS
ncbi:MAG: tRNA pseudouridine(38-40) synthase TruA, partial [Spirochaetaceae bacterium]|nr:tRNA pseudouridine(38-40) synthase TruA [Spirochaetaceae bacterium]